MSGVFAIFFRISHSDCDKIKTQNSYNNLHFHDGKDFEQFLHNYDSFMFHILRNAYMASNEICSVVKTILTSKMN